MFEALKCRINNFFKGDTRSVKAKKNILYSFVIKGLNIVIALLLVPITLNYLNKYEYGVWLTLSSILMWVNYFDIGLGNGLRNKLTEVLALGNKKLGQIYVSTTFFMLFIIMCILFSLFCIAQHWLDWNIILNVDPLLVDNLNSIITIAFAFFCVTFVFKFIGSIYLADQRSATNDLFMLLGNAFSLLIIYVLTLTTKGSLEMVAIIYSAAPAVIFILAYPFTFYGRYRELHPKISAVRLTYFKDLMGLGIQFFFLQIGGLLIFTTSNIIISRVLSPEQVTPYNIAFRYFSVVTMVFGIITSPMWSAATDAYVRGDIFWIRKMMKNMIKVWSIGIIITGIMIICANFIYNIWVGNEIKIPILLSVLTGLYVLLITWSTCFSTFIFGIGKLRLQLYSTMISGILFIPLAVYMAQIWGVVGIMLGLCLVNIPGAILNPIQYKKIVSEKARGIWNK